MNPTQAAPNAMQPVTLEELITALAQENQDPTVERARAVLDGLDMREIWFAEDRATAIREVASRPSSTQPVPPASRNEGAPAFMVWRHKMAVMDWDSVEDLPDYSGIAYDPMVNKFCLTMLENGERTINYLLSPTRAEAEREADALRAKLATADLVFADLGGRTVIDIITEEGRGRFGGNTFQEIRARYPKAMVLTLDQAVEAIENSIIDPVASRITREEFIDALKILPPNKWHNAPDAETFMSSEHLSGMITRVYARVGEEYFSFLDRCTLTHDQIMRKVEASKQVLAPAAPEQEAATPKI